MNVLGPGLIQGKLRPPLTRVRPARHHDGSVIDPWLRRLSWIGW
ncbi:MAG: hypothetical protein RL375_930 [Pseudomonadota bacterium]|jgi:hypothetical protein